MTIVLRSFEINGFRGLRTLSFGFQGNKALLLHGLNGTGKSSLHQALTFAFTGILPPVSELPAPPGPKVFRHAALDANTPASVHIVFSDGVVDRWIRREIDVHGNVHTTTSPESQSVAENAVNSLCFMTRRQFSSMIDAVERDSWNRLTPFLGHQELSDYREGLRNLANWVSRDLELSGLQRQQNQAKNARSQAQSHRQQVLLQLQIDDINPEALAAQLSQVLQQPIEVSAYNLVDWEQLESRLPASARAKELATQLQELAEEKTLGRIQGLDRDALQRALDFAVELGHNDDLGHDLAHAEFLEASKRTVGSLTVELCPLCGLGPPEWDKVRGDLESRSLVLKEAVKNLGTARGALTTYKVSLTSVSDRVRDWIAGHQARPQLSEFHEALSQLVTIADMVCDRMLGTPPRGMSEDERELLETSRKTTSQALRALADALRTREEELTNEEKNLAGITELRRFMLLKEAVQADIRYRTADHDDRLLSAQVTQTQAIIRILQDLFSDVDRAEAELSAQLLQDLEAEVQRIFAILTDGTQLTPQIRSRTERGIRMADIVIQDFYGLGTVLARDYLSEANRNSLGLAIYFAGLMRRRPDLRVLVIDDITHSADNSHRRGLAQFLANELSGNIQLVILTHDEHWHGRLKETLAPDTWVEVLVISWSPDGLTFKTDTWKTLLQKARQQITNREPSGGNSLRHALEQFVEDACERYGVLIPYKRSPSSIKFNEKRQRLEKAITDLWTSGTGIVNPQAPAVRLLVHSQKIANLSSHYASYDSWSHQDLLDALSDVSDLFDQFTCKNMRGPNPCGGMLPTLKRDAGQLPRCPRCGQTITV